mmetsp:Transcript_93275/g.301711  ORF Transcript_93275/g.301711 Transcript_93275/m.301711 type:complete len:652 (-) Transcript_93275:325-2280(-)
MLAPRGYAPLPTASGTELEHGLPPARPNSGARPGGSHVCLSTLAVSVVLSVSAFWGLPWTRPWKSADLGGVQQAFKTLDATIFSSFLEADQDNDGLLDSKEFDTLKTLANLTKEEAEYAFEGLDADLDGKVSAKEYLGAQALGHFHFNRSAQEIADAVKRLERRQPEQRARIRALVRGGGMQLLELKKRMQNLTAKEALDRLDRDRDGQLSLKELESGRSKVFRPPLSSAEAAYVLRGTDVDLDGHVALLELQGIFELGHFFPSSQVTTTTTATTTTATTTATATSTSSSTRASTRTSSSRSSTSTATTSSTSSTTRTVTSTVSRTATSTRTTTSQTASARVKRITLGHFLKRIRQTYETPLAMFRAMSGSDFGGSFGLPEILKTCDSLEPPLDEATAAYAFAGFDADGDGRVTSTEFLGTIFLQHLFQSPEALDAVGAFNAAPPRQPAPTLRTPAGAYPQWQEDARDRLGRLIHDTPGRIFPRIDEDGDGSASYEEFLGWSRTAAPPIEAQQAESAFLALDADHDMTLSSQEFVGALSRDFAALAAAGHLDDVRSLRTRAGLRPELPTQEGESLAEALDWVADADADGDQRLDFPEFFQGASEFPLPLTLAEAQFAFAGADGDRDGRLSIAELEHIFVTGRFASARSVHV